MTAPCCRLHELGGPAAAACGPAASPAGRHRLCVCDDIDPDERPCLMCRPVAAAADYPCSPAPGVCWAPGCGRPAVEFCVRCAKDHISGRSVDVGACASHVSEHDRWHDRPPAELVDADAVILPSPVGLRRLRRVCTAPGCQKPAGHTYNPAMRCNRYCEAHCEEAFEERGEPMLPSKRWCRACGRGLEGPCAGEPCGTCGHAAHHLNSAAGDICQHEGCCCERYPGGAPAPSAPARRCGACGGPLEPDRIVLCVPCAPRGPGRCDYCGDCHAPPCTPGGGL